MASSTIDVYGLQPYSSMMYGCKLWADLKDQLKSARHYLALPRVWKAQSHGGPQGNYYVGHQRLGDWWGPAYCSAHQAPPRYVG